MLHDCVHSPHDCALDDDDDVVSDVPDDDCVHYDGGDDVLLVSCLQEEGLRMIILGEAKGASNPEAND